MHAALELMHKLGWVHRDVSIGNILSYNGEAKLCDLEYAKKNGDTKTHNVRTVCESLPNLSQKC
jgi:serine/threonine protein kinase